MSEIPAWGCDGCRCQMYDDCPDGICEMAAIWEKAIMEERERCAKIADDMYLDMMQDKDMRGVRERHEWVCRDIASSIRGTS